MSSRRVVHSMPVDMKARHHFVGKFIPLFILIMFAVLSSNTLSPPAASAADLSKTKAQDDHPQSPQEHYFTGFDFLISHANAAQYNPGLAYNTTRDEWLVVWHDGREGTMKIYAQRVSADGEPLGGDILVRSSADNLFDPRVAYDGEHDRYLVVWSDHTNPAIQSIMLNWDGTAFGAMVSITSGTKGRLNPDVAFNSITHQYQVVWQYDEALGNGDIWGRLVSNTGTLVGVNTTIAGNPEDETLPALAVNTAAGAHNGEILVVWIRKVPAPTGLNIVGQRLNTSGVSTGALFAVGRTGFNDNKRNPHVAANELNGQYLVVWDDLRSATRGIYGQLINSDGSHSGINVLINDDLGDQTNPTISYNILAGEFMVAWSSNLMPMSCQRVSAALSLQGEVTPISSEGSDQVDAMIVYGYQRYLVVWHGNPDTVGDIYGQIISAEGSLVDFDFNLSLPEESQNWPAVAYDSTGSKWLVVYEDDHNGNTDIYGQFVERIYGIAGDPFPIIIDTHEQIAPAVVYNLTADKFLVVWEDYRNGQAEIYAQFLDSDGTLLPGITRVTMDSNDQISPAVAFNNLAEGQQYLVVWEDRRDDSGNIYARRINGDGSFVDTTDFALTTRTARQRLPQTAFNPLNRDYLVVWEDASLPTSGIAGQLVSDGKPRLTGANFNIAAGGNLHTPSVASSLLSGEYLVAWADFTNAADTNLRARRVDGSGNPLGPMPIVISNATGNQFLPYVTYGVDHDMYAVWWADFRTPADPAIYSQALTSGGALDTSNFVGNLLTYDGPGEQNAPVSAFAGSIDEYLLVWQDLRNGETAKIYGQVGHFTDLQVQSFLPALEYH